MTDLQATRSKGTGVSSLWYLLAGGGIGAVAALLFAPKSGADLRTDISDLTKKGYEETVDLAHQIKEQSADVYNSFKEKTGRVYDLAATKWSYVDNSAARSLSKKVVTQPTKFEAKASPKVAAGRKAANIL